MALRKELSSLYSLLLSKAKLLPIRVQPRTLQDIDALFKNYETLNNSAVLEDICSKARTKLAILEMSIPDQETVPREKEPGKTNYVVQDGHLKEGSATKKVTMDFSNWHGGNVDPDELRRHKELLERQHFGGPFWENRPRNPSIIDEIAPRYEKVEAEPRPPETLRKAKESAFEVVKR